MLRRHSNKNRSLSLNHLLQETLLRGQKKKPGLARKFNYYLRSSENEAPSIKNKAWKKFKNQSLCFSWFCVMKSSIIDKTCSNEWLKRSLPISDWETCSSHVPAFSVISWPGRYIVCFKHLQPMELNNTYFPEKLTAMAGPDPTKIESFQVRFISFSKAYNLHIQQPAAPSYIARNSLTQDFCRSPWRFVRRTRGFKATNG